MDRPKWSGVNPQGRGIGIELWELILKETSQGRLMGIGPWFYLGEMGLGQTLAIGRLGSLARSCPVPEVLENRGQQGRQVSRGQGRVCKRLGEEHRGLMEAITRD